MPAASEGTGVPAAITGEQTAASGEAYGVVGTSASPLGAGLYAANSAPDAYDLVLDGSSDGAADTHVSQSGLDIPSASPQQFSMGNSGGGTFTLEVSGTVAGEFIGGGAGLTGVPVGAHLHAGTDIASGTVAEPRIAAAIARDSEVFGLVTAGDGAGSGLDADLLDGLQASALQTQVLRQWSNSAIAIETQIPTLTSIFDTTLAAGAWLVTANLNLFLASTSTAPADVQCQLFLGGQPMEIHQAWPPHVQNNFGIAGSTWGSGQTTLTLVGAIQSAGSIPVKVDCTATNTSATASVGWRSLVALKVGSVGAL